MVMKYELLHLQFELDMETITLKSKSFGRGGVGLSLTIKSSLDNLFDMLFTVLLEISFSVCGRMIGIKPHIAPCAKNSWMRMQTSVCR